MRRFDKWVGRFRNQFGGGIKENIVFVHIPKCGGVSISESIRRNYFTLDMRKDRSLVGIDPAATYAVASTFAEVDPFENDYLEVLQLEERLLMYFMSQPGIRYVTGHFGFSDAAYERFAGRFAYITILRDPVERVISHFLYNKFKAPGIGMIEGELETYMSSDRFRNQGHEYVKKLYGRFDRPLDYGSPAVIEKAKANLKKFAVVGLLEDMPGFVSSFQRRFGVKLDVPLRNTSPTSGSYKEKFFTDEVRARIAEICAPDFEVYRLAAELARGEQPEAAGRG